MAEQDPFLRRIERHSVVACGLLAAGAWLLTRGRAAPLGVVGGGLLVVISYRGIKAGINVLADPAGDADRGVRTAIGLVKFFTRYAILAGAAYVIMARLRLPPVAVCAGASSLVIAVMVEALRGVTSRER